MDTAESLRLLLQDATDELMERWELSRPAAAAALTDVAAELAVDVEDLAGLVACAAQQRRAQGPSRHNGRPDRPGRSLVLVSNSPTAVTRVPENRRTVCDPRRGDSTRRWRREFDDIAQVSTDKPTQATVVRPPPPEWPGAGQGLTWREAQVLTLIVAGLSNRAIAEELYLSPNSIKTYIRTAYRKMGTKNRTQAVVWGIDHGLRAVPIA